jgi:hypothetical protein
VQTERHARVGCEEREGHECQRGKREVREQDQGEGHRMQRVSGRKAVAVQSRSALLQLGTADDRALTRRAALEHPVQREIDEAGEQDQARALPALLARDERQRHDEPVP